MKKNIRWFVLFVLLLGLMTFAACGNNNDKKDEVDTQNTESDYTKEDLENLLKKEWKYKYVPELSSEFEKYSEGYDGYLALISVDGDKMRISSASYDGDARDNFIVKEVKIAKNVTYCDLSINTVISKEGEKSEGTYTELTQEDMELILDSTLGIGFVWFNDDMEIEKIMFYGELTNWE